MSNNSLICITTCNRLLYLKWLLPDYLVFCNQNADYDLVVALDGNDKEYIDFCNSNQIPLIYSEERLGVGISKNRAFQTFPDYKHYFFIDDDAELMDSSIFSTIIELADKTGIPHFSFGGGHGFKPITGRITENNYTVIQSKYGSGQFSYFNGNALRQVGGWHTLFAKYKRGGHTEHTYRFYHAALSPAPFHHVPKLNSGYMNWHQPEHVTQLKNVKISINSRLEEEEKLIDKKLKYFPVETLSNYSHNNIPSQIDMQSFDYSTKLSKDYIKKIIVNPFLNSSEKKQTITYFIYTKQDKIEVLTKELIERNFEINLIKNSPSYKIGKAIAKPAHILKKLFSY